MRNPDLLPERDDAFAIFTNNFTEKAIAHHAAWQIPEREITALSAANAHFQTCWEIARNKKLRTSVQVCAKQVTRKTLESVLRPFISRYIRYSSTVTDEERLLLGIKPRKKTRTAIPAPVTIPFVAISRSSGNSVLLHFREESDVPGHTKRRLPTGVGHIELRMRIGTKPATLEDCNRCITVTRTTYRMEHTPKLRLQEIFFFARWRNTRGTGPWSRLVSFVML